MEEIIRAENLGFNYGDGWIFRGLDFYVEKGDFLAVIGPNGAGKSTLLRIIAHILEPTEGKVMLFGQDIKAFRDWGKIGYVPQNPGRQQRNFPISVREVVRLGRLDGRSILRRFGKEDEAAVDKAMETFSLQDLADKKIGELSGGQQQRVFLARAMVNSPELLLLDEPATGIDPDAKEDLYGMLAGLNQENRTVVMISHDLELAARYGRRAMCVDRGICFYGDIHEALQHRHRHRYF